MFTAMRVLWGDGGTARWLEGIKANEPVYFADHTATVAGVGSGEVDVGFVNHYYAMRFIAENGNDFPVRNYHLRSGGPGNLVMISGAGILANTKNRDNAEALLRFLLSREVQQYITEKTFDYPVVDGVAANPVLTPLSEIQRPEVEQMLLDDIRATQTLMREVGVIP